MKALFNSSRYNLLTVILLLAASMQSCSWLPTGTVSPAVQSPAVGGAPQLTLAPGSFGSPTPTDIWTALLDRTPYPHTTPLPAPNGTMLDGTYAKIDPDEILPIHCVRCPDYAPDGGAWKLHLDKGIYRIYYQVTGWRSLASFTIERDRFYIFNDPYCHLETGVYRWKLEAGDLTFQVIEDDCAIGLRAENLTSQPWLSCRPPSTEAAITDHWLKPDGCEP